MKILIVGSAWHDNLINVVSHGFSELGYTASVFDDSIKSTALTISKIANRLPFPALRDWCDYRYRTQIGAALRARITAEKPDMLFVINGIKYLYADIARIRADFKIPVAAYVIDDPLLVRTWLYDLGAYSHLFVIDRSWMGYMEFFSADRVFYLPQTADHRAFRPLGLPSAYDIAFGGALSLRLPNAPSGFLRARILNAIAEAGFSVHAFVSGIAEAIPFFPALRSVQYYDGYKSHEDLNVLYNRAKIIVSIHSPQFKTGISPRVFEAAFAGGFQLIQYEEDVLRLFPECGEVSFHSERDLLSKIRYYLTHDDERVRISGIMRKIALRDHTFRSRAEEIIKKIYGN